jgi:hypothetical protein
MPKKFEETYLKDDFNFQAFCVCVYLLCSQKVPFLLYKTKKIIRVLKIKSFI